MRFSRKSLWFLAPFVGLLLAAWWVSSFRPRPTPGISGPPQAITWTPDGQVLVCASSNGVLQSLEPGREHFRSFYRPDADRRSLPDSQILPNRLCFSTNGNTLFTAGAGPAPGFVGSANSFQAPAHAWNWKTRRHLFSFNYVAGQAFDVTRDGKWAIMGFGAVADLVSLQASPLPPGKYRAYNPADWKEFPRQPIKFFEARTISAVAFAPDAKTVAMATDNGEISLWDVRTKTQLAQHTPNFGESVNFLQWPHVFFGRRRSATLERRRFETAQSLRHRRPGRGFARRKDAGDGH